MHLLGSDVLFFIVRKVATIILCIKHLVESVLCYLLFFYDADWISQQSAVESKGENIDMIDYWLNMSSYTIQYTVC